MSDETRRLHVVRMHGYFPGDHRGINQSITSQLFVAISRSISFHEGNLSIRGTSRTIAKQLSSTVTLVENSKTDHARPKVSEVPSALWLRWRKSGFLFWFDCKQLAKMGIQ